MNPMARIRVLLDRESFIRTLNHPHADPELWLKTAAQFVVNPASVSVEELNWVVAAKVSTLLRPLVDEWLGTGFNPDGSGESPHERDLFRTYDALHTSLAYLQKEPVTFAVPPFHPAQT